MSAPLIFMDTETTGLSLDDDIWEFAAIRRDPDGDETELHLFIEHDRYKCDRLPESFREDHYDRFRDHRAVSQSRAISEMQDLFNREGGKPHVVGAVPNFDTERVAKLCADHGRSAPIWHHHLIDVENLAVGYLAAQVARYREDGIEIALADRLVLPWRSDDLAAAVGVTISEDERHTAMGDARWAMRIYDAVMGGAA